MPSVSPVAAFNDPFIYIHLLFAGLGFHVQVRVVSGAMSVAGIHCAYYENTDQIDKYYFEKMLHLNKDDKWRSVIFSLFRNFVIDFSTHRTFL